MRIVGIALVAALAGCSSVAPTATQVGTLLTITTAPAFSGPPGVPVACAAAGLLPVVIGREADALTFRNSVSKQPVAIIWPHGFSARLVNGKGELLDPSGAIIGREGDTLADLGGGTGSDGEAFGVCSIGNRIYP